MPQFVTDCIAAVAVLSVVSFAWIDESVEIRCSAWTCFCARRVGLIGVEKILRPPGSPPADPPADLDDLEALLAMLEALRAGEPRSVEYRFRRGDGELAWFRATVALIGESADGDLRIVGAVQDVTTQRRLEREVAARVGVTEALDGWRSLELSAADLLAGVARIMGFALGALWIRDGDQFAVHGVWHTARLAAGRTTAPGDGELTELEHHAAPGSRSCSSPAVSGRS